LSQVSDRALDDGDGVAAQLAAYVAADILILLCDAEAVLAPPGSHVSRSIDVFHPNTPFATGAIRIPSCFVARVPSRGCFTAAIGPESESGRGGMETKARLVFQAFSPFHIFIFTPVAFIDRHKHQLQFHVHAPHHLRVLQVAAALAATHTGVKRVVIANGKSNNVIQVL
jgi:hypothetical protein